MLRTPSLICNGKMRRFKKVNIRLVTVINYFMQRIVMRIITISIF